MTHPRGFITTLIWLCDSIPFPNPLTQAAGSTVIELEGRCHFARTLDDLPPIYLEIEQGYNAALEQQASFSELQSAIARQDCDAIKAIWDPLVRDWDERTFYDFPFQCLWWAQL